MRFSLLTSDWTVIGLPNGQRAPARRYRFACDPLQPVARSSGLTSRNRPEAQRVLAGAVTKQGSQAIGLGGPAGWGTGVGWSSGIGTPGRPGISGGTGSTFPGMGGTAGISRGGSAACEVIICFQSLSKHPMSKARPMAQAFSRLLFRGVSMFAATAGVGDRCGENAPLVSGVAHCAISGDAVESGFRSNPDDRWQPISPAPCRFVPRRP